MTALTQQANNTATMDEQFFQIAHEGITKLKENIRSIITIEESKLEYILAAKIAGGHVMIADVHGVGKTSLVKALAASINWEDPTTQSQKTSNANKKSKSQNIKQALTVKQENFARIQCTVDLLPQDILGFNHFDLSNQKYSFQSGPIFAHFLLCDEINMLTPKTQGSFFQIMEENEITIEGVTYSVEKPFFIIATRNLRGNHLYNLPLPQLDRFMVQISLNYPNADEELHILKQHSKEDAWDNFEKGVVDSSELIAWSKLVDFIALNTDVYKYIVAILQASRRHPSVLTALSPRAGIKLVRLARALALVRGDSFVTIDLVKELVVPALAHRLELKSQKVTQDEVQGLENIMKEIVNEVAIKY